VALVTRLVGLVRGVDADQYRRQLRMEESDEDPDERWSEEEIEAEVARAEASGMPGFRLEVFVELEDGRRIGDSQYASRSFSLLPSIVVFAPAGSDAPATPSVEERVKEAAGRAFRRTGDPRTEGGHLASLARALEDEGIEVPLSELASAHLVFEFDDVARRLMASDSAG
jgi:hypothetical protein